MIPKVAISVNSVKLAHIVGCLLKVSKANGLIPYEGFVYIALHKACVTIPAKSTDSKTVSCELTKNSGDCNRDGTVQDGIHSNTVKHEPTNKVNIA